jgi:adenine-specific DNA-methyltransferase
MTNNKQKLELTWIGKEDELKLEPRILIEDPNKSIGDTNSENILIHGDNLLALKALEQDYSGKIKCIYIDPPYNTGSAFEHYADNLEHSIWLSLMRQRLEILKALLDKENGSIWISIDDDERDYLKILCDEIFGRGKFIGTCVWQKRYSRENREAIGDVHEYILVYASSPDQFKKIRNRVPLTEAQQKVYKNPNNDPRGRWRPIPMTAQGYRPNQMYPITSPSGKIFTPPEGLCWAYIEPRYKEMLNAGRIYFGKKGDSQPNIIRYLTEVQGLVPWSWWNHEEVGHTDEAKKEMIALFGRENVFETPKPERLLQRILLIASNKGDLVLDSFLGSGTTSAVAHKMGRKWIGVEFGEQASTHCQPRLKKVVAGNVGLPLSETLGWKGGGGFKFYNLAPSLLRKDSFGNFVIDEKYNANMLSATMCKHEGFKYSPNETTYWKQGKSTESDYILVTTGFMTVEHLNAIHAQMTESESLLICAKSYAPECANHFPNININKIPQSILESVSLVKIITT